MSYRFEPARRARAAAVAATRARPRGPVEQAGPGTGLPARGATISRLLGAAVLVAHASCSGSPRTPPSNTGPSGPRAPVVADTCGQIYPSYWQDPAPAFAAMWAGQHISNAPPEGWSGPVFELSDRFPSTPQDDSGAQAWRHSRYDELFDPATSTAEKAALGEDYIWAVMRYIQEGNIDSGDVNTDWTLCNNPVRNWYHMPFQTYEPLSGREFIHGLTREAPVTFSLQKGDTVDTTVWAVGFYNPTAAHTLGTVWGPDGKARMPTTNISFDEGAVVGKLLFTTAVPEELPFLENMPVWQANISDPTFCQCTPSDGKACSMAEQSLQCPRTTTRWNDGRVYLMQFDIAVKDSRAAPTGWVLGTFVADGQRKASEPNPWNRISPLGLMWGNDPPPPGQLAASYPPDPRANGFAQEIVFWDVADMLNAAGSDPVLSAGHLGCNRRLNGPADSNDSSCISCHMTASVPDANRATPPFLAQIGEHRPGDITFQCVTPSAPGASTGKDASGVAATAQNGITFEQMDAIYFANIACAEPMNMSVQTAGGPRNVLGDGVPTYPDGGTTWRSTDFSLQLSISLVQWAEWQENQQQAHEARKFESDLPGR